MSAQKRSVSTYNAGLSNRACAPRSGDNSSAAVESKGAHLNFFKKLFPAGGFFDMKSGLLL
jgi:hypothetical protein